MGMIPLYIYHDSSEVTVRSLAFTQITVLCIEYVYTIYVCTIGAYTICAHNVQMYTLRACMTAHGFEIMFPFNVHTIRDLWRDVDEHGGSMWFMRISSQPSRMDGNCMKAVREWGMPTLCFFWKMVINIDLNIMFSTIFRQTHI